MALILHLETATTVCSVALSKDGHLVALRESTLRNAHSSLLTEFIGEVMKEAGIDPSGINAVSVSMGPGSYTGLRIGVAAAKGFCYSREIPMIAVPTLQAMAMGMALHPDVTEKDLLCPMLDARRMEVYCGLYNNLGMEMREVRAEIIDTDSFSGYLENGTVLFGGDGAAKCKPLLREQKNARFIDGFEASAKFMIPLAELKFRTGQVEDLAYFEPFYLKEFIAGKPSVKGLHS